jgi:hypothetical protein
VVLPPDPGRVSARSTRLHEHFNSTAPSGQDLADPVGDLLAGCSDAGGGLPRARGATAHHGRDALEGEPHTPRHTRLKRHQVVQPTRAGAKPAVARLWPNNRLIAYLAWSSASPRSLRARGSPRRSGVRVGISCLARGIDRLDALEDEPHRRPRVHEGWVGAIWVLTGTVPGDPAQCVSRGCHQCVTPLRMAEFPAAASLRWGDECTVMHFEPK